MIFPTVPVKAIAPLLGLLLSLPTAPSSVVDKVVRQIIPPPNTERVQPLAEVISRGEGDWNAVNRGHAGDTPGGLQSLLGMTCESLLIADLINLQRQGRIYAIGRYQFIPSTLLIALKHAKDVTPRDFFSPAIQDKLLVALLEHKRPEVWEYLEGDGSVGAALDALAREWASIGTAHGGTFYTNTSNRAHITRDEARVALEESKELF